MGSTVCVSIKAIARLYLICMQNVSFVLLLFFVLLSCYVSPQACASLAFTLMLAFAISCRNEICKRAATNTNEAITEFTTFYAPTAAAAAASLHSKIVRKLQPEHLQTGKEKEWLHTAERQQRQPSNMECKMNRRKKPANSRHYRLRDNQINKAGRVWVRVRSLAYSLAMNNLEQWQKPATTPKTEEERWEKKSRSRDSVRFALTLQTITKYVCVFECKYWSSAH